MSKKNVVPNQVDKHSNKKFKVKAHAKGEQDVDIEVVDDGDFTVEKLDIEGLPATIEGKPIRWLNNFAIKKGTDYINQRYKVTIVGLGKGRVVLIDNNSSGSPYFFTGPVVDDTIELSDGDPAIGTS